MKELLDKLSSYNIFNYLLPGVLFAAIGDCVTGYPLTHDNMVIGVFVYYFYGLVISRLGSLVLEPLFKKMRFVTFSPYNDFIEATKIDNKLETLSEANNSYRTLAALFLMILVLACLRFIGGLFPRVSAYYRHLGIFTLFLLFALSYRKQTKYISSRIQNILSLNDR